MRWIHRPSWKQRRRQFYRFSFLFTFSFDAWDKSYYPLISCHNIEIKKLISQHALDFIIRCLQELWPNGMYRKYSTWQAAIHSTRLPFVSMLPVPAESSSRVHYLMAFPWPEIGKISHELGASRLPVLAHSKRGSSAVPPLAVPSMSGCLIQSVLLLEGIKNVGARRNLS